MNEGSFSGPAGTQAPYWRREGERKILLYNSFVPDLSEEWVGSTHMGPLLQVLLGENDIHKGLYACGLLNWGRGIWGQR